jgi:hypothetical protein
MRLVESFPVKLLETVVQLMKAGVSWILLLSIICIVTPRSSVLNLAFMLL